MKRICTALCVLLLLLLSGCASIVSGTKQEVSFQSTPDSATVTVNGRVLGKTPFTNQLDKKADQTVVFTKDGYKPVVMQLTTSLDPWFWGNIVLGGLIGSTVDGISGAVNQYAPSQYHITLEKEEVSKNEGATSKTQQVRIKEFIIVRHGPIIADMHSGGGENATALFVLLNVPDDKQQDAARKVRALSEVFKDPPQFADQVINVLYTP
jgi:uncharacterized protein YceK